MLAVNDRGIGMDRDEPVLHKDRIDAVPALIRELVEPR